MTAIHSPPKIFTRGTLSYTKQGLWMLGFWIMWNDICVMLMENVSPSLTPLLLKDNGATNTEIALFSTTLTGIFTLWINPVVSTWSDRHRSPMGRRKPFLYLSAPFTAFFLGAIPFMPDLARWLSHYHSLANVGSRFGVVLIIGICILAYSVFNSVIQAIFSYLYIDVVPEEVLGRFKAFVRIAATISTFVWNYFIFGMAEKYMKWVFVGVAAFYLGAYLMSLWNIKEGEYPPPDTRKFSIWEIIKGYFTDCFKPYYLWFFVGTAIFQIGNVSNAYQIFYFRDQLHLGLDTIGKLRSIPTILVIVLGYSIGALVDRLKPGKVMIVALFLFAMVNIAAFFFLKDRGTLFFFMGLIALVTSLWEIGSGVFIVSFYPREKFGQFCSANAFTYNLCGCLSAYFVGVFFDWIKDYRYAFLWSSMFYLLALPFFIMCYLNWKKLQEQYTFPL